MDFWNVKKQVTVRHRPGLHTRPTGISIFIEGALEGLGDCGVDGTIAGVTSTSTVSSSFIWAAGIEDTFIPQTRAGLRALDEYELIDHYTHWREDLALAKSLGVHALRWGVPWYRVEPKAGIFDWRWTDQVIPYLADDLKINPIIDLMHYGCPFWLEREFAHPDYPKRVADYAGAFAERYKSRITWFTPLNEPIMNAWMCGQRGVWPPYLRGDAGFVRLMLQIARGIVRTGSILKEINPQNVLAHVDVMSGYYGHTKKQKIAADFLFDRTQLCYDLIAGRVNESHPLWPWLLQNGASADALLWFQHNTVPIDVMGLNFYPQWSSRQVGFDSMGRRFSRPVFRDGANFSELITRYYEKYRRPIMITETSAFGRHDVRSRWLADSTNAVQQLRSAGVPLIGYTWFPMLTMVTWSYRYGTMPASEYDIDLGLFKLNRKGSPRWQEMPLAEEFRRLIKYNPPPTPPDEKREAISI
jgi:beta-glucosidase/6-phospho-beta-glucosidase/beta-galactosidase